MSTGEFACTGGNGGSGLSSASQSRSQQQRHLQQLFDDDILMYKAGTFVLFVLLIMLGLFYAFAFNFLEGRVVATVSTSYAKQYD
jgi:hypothetical protein